jgi:hypothetical protein
MYLNANGDVMSWIEKHRISEDFVSRAEKASRESNGRAAQYYYYQAAMSENEALQYVVGIPMNPTD